MEISESLKKFLEKFSQDEELQAKMQEATNPDEAYAIASAAQGGFTKEEFVEVMTELKKQTSEEISDDDLEQVAGGKVNWTKITKITASVTKTVTMIVSASAKAAV